MVEPRQAGAPRLDSIRGPVPARHHNARTIAALTSNPGCARRAVLDAAGVDKARVAVHLGFPSRFGQSPFAITRGNAFEAQVKADGCAELLRLLREHLDLPIPEVTYGDLEIGDPARVGGADLGPEARYARTRAALARLAGVETAPATLFDHPLLRLDVGGRFAYLEPDLIALRVNGRFHIVEIKSFAIIDGQADGEKVAAAATQAAVYVLALRDLLADLGHPPGIVSHDVVLVCPENFANRPTAALIDVRKQLNTLKRQLSRLDRVDELVESLPAGVTFDLEVDAAGAAHRPVAELAGSVRAVEARYAPECLASCEMSYFCRDESHGRTESLGRTVRDDLGGMVSVADVLEIAAGRRAPADDEAEAARVLRLAVQLRGECLS